MCGRDNNLFTRLGTAVLLLSLAVLSYAGMPVYSLTPQTPTAVTVAKNSTAIVSYLVTNNTKITRTLTLRPMAAVTHTGTASFCSNPFTLSPQQSCLLVLTINGAELAYVPSQRIIGGPVVCKTEGPGNNSPSPFLCSQPSAANVLIASLNGSLTNASITVGGSPLGLKVGGPAGSLTITNMSTDVLATNIVANLTGPLANAGVAVTGNTCTSLAPQMSCTLTFLPGNMPVSLTQFPIQGDNTNVVTATISVSVPQRYAYFTNFNDGSVTQCMVNNDSGELSSCGPTGVAADTPYGITVFNGYTYSANFDGYVAQCTINPLNGSLSACSRNYSQPSLSAITTNNGYVYIASFSSSTVTKCTIDPTNGGFFNCAVTGSSFNNPQGGIAINNGYAYVTNTGNDSVIKCTVNSGTGELTNCATTGIIFNAPVGIAISNGYAYIANYGSNTVSQCTVNSSTGELANCTNNAFPFDGPNGVGVLNGYIYISNFNGSTVSKCSQTLGTGELVGCVTTGSNFNGPAGDIGFVTLP